MLGLWIALGAIGLLVLVLVVRALLFNPKAQRPISEEAVNFDRDQTVENLAQLVRCKTISYNDHALEDEEE